MHSQPLGHTFTLADPGHTLTCTLNEQHTQLTLSLRLPTPTFPKLYHRSMQQPDMQGELRFAFGGLVDLFRALNDKQAVTVGADGVIGVGYVVTARGEETPRVAEIRLQRAAGEELDEIRKAVGRGQDLQAAEELSGRIDKLWRREEENEKIFMKFKEDVEFRMEEIHQRMGIQNTRISIIRDEVAKLTDTMEKLCQILCPVFCRLNMGSPFTSEFILQDRKVVYTGEPGNWTQLLLNHELKGDKKQEFLFKILASKRCNIVVGVTALANLKSRSSLATGKGEKNSRKFVGLSGMGQLYSFDSPQFGNLLLTHHVESQKEGAQVEPENKMHKSSHEITLPSPQGALPHPKSPVLHPKSLSGEVFKPMQAIRMCVELQKLRISWKSNNKTLHEYKIPPELRSQALAPYLEFCDPGDAVQLLQFA